MSTPVHDDDDVSGVTSSGLTSSGALPGTEEVREVFASTEPVLLTALEPPEAAEPPEATEPPEAVEPAEAAGPPEAAEPAEAAGPTEAAEPAEAAGPPEAAKPTEAAEPAEADQSVAAGESVEAEQLGGPDKPAEDELADQLISMQAALAAHLKARANRPMSRPRSTQAPARASEMAFEGERRWDPNTPSQPSDPQSPPVAPDIREETDAPPTAPEAAAVRRPLIQASVATPNAISSMRLPQGLGGPNIAAPSALELLRARNAIPPGTEGLPGSRLPALSRSSQFEGDVAIRALRQRLALAPDFVAPPPVSRRSRSMMPSLGRFSLVLLVASTVALSVALVTLPDTRPTILKGENGSQLASVSNTQQPPARLIGVEGRQNFSNEAISLEISLYGASGSELALLSGLVSGTRLSVGGPFGDSGWRLPARDLMSALAYAPKDFIGVMNAAIDLRLPNDRLLDSRVMRLEWVPRRPTGPQVLARRPELDDLKSGTRPEFRLEPKLEPKPEQKPEAKPEPVPEGKPALQQQQIDGPEIAALLKRGQDYLQNGDIVSARLMLRRAATAGDAHAALLLGATFDPIVLRDLGVLGFSPDPAQARTWYQRAADAGLPEATRRLERLVKTAR
jgi:hypothetical protein